MQLDALDECIVTSSNFWFSKLHYHNNFKYSLFLFISIKVKGVGDYGMPVNLLGREKQLGEEIMKTEAFNLVAR